MTARHLSIPIKAVLFATLPLFLFGYMLIPRSQLPTGEPVLTLDAAPAAAQIKHDIALASKAPQGQAAQALRGLFLEAGRAELHRTQGLDQLTSRRAKMAKLLTQLRQQHGETSVDALRAEATRALANILTDHTSDKTSDNVTSGDVGKTPPLKADNTRARLGAFGNQLAVHDATLNGLPVAPMLVIYTMYKARWNQLHGQVLDLGFSTIETQAYYGWKAMHARTVPIQGRLDALVPYKAAGGRHVDELAGLLLMAGGALSAARPAFAHADTERPSLRTRNYLAYIQEALAE